MKHLCPSYRSARDIHCLSQAVVSQENRARELGCLRAWEEWCCGANESDTLQTFCESVKCQLHFEFILSGLEWQDMLLLLSRILSNVWITQSKCFKAITGALFTPDTFTDIRAADTDRQRDVWQIKETSAKSSSKRGEDRRRDGIWGQRKRGKDNFQHDTFQSVNKIERDSVDKMIFFYLTSWVMLALNDFSKALTDLSASSILS